MHAYEVGYAPSAPLLANVWVDITVLETFRHLQVVSGLSADGAFQPLSLQAGRPLARTRLATLVPTLSTAEAPVLCRICRHPQSPQDALLPSLGRGQRWQQGQAGHAVR